MFQFAKTTEVSVSDVHILISTFKKTQTTRLLLKKVIYKDFKYFNKTVFLEDVKLKNSTLKINDSTENYEFLSCKSHSVVNKHAPSKTKIIQGNNTPYVNKTLRKDIHKRSALRNKLFKKYKYHPNVSNMRKHSEQAKCFLFLK